jgi:hypothetical protein
LLFLPDLLLACPSVVPLIFSLYRLPYYPLPLAAVLGRYVAWPNPVLAASRPVIPPVRWHELAPLWVLPHR